VASKSVPSQAAFNLTADRSRFAKIPRDVNTSIGFSGWIWALLASIASDGTCFSNGLGKF